ncbi:MAG: DUF2090 domain-containing protein [Patescibacteria group bacterium]|jgi:myo-inositol catabolism protein IolC
MKNLFFLPFDHRASFAEELLRTTYPVASREARRIRHLKRIIFSGFIEVYRNSKKKEEFAILVDEEFGKKILKSARRKKIAFALTTEQSGGESLAFEYSDALSDHLKRFRPTYAKVLIRYAPEKQETHARIHKRLKELQMIARDLHIKILIEILVKGSKPKYQLLIDAIKNLQQDGILPDLWKVEGLNSTKEWQQVARATEIPLIVLGRGASKKQVRTWIQTAAKSGVVSGMAIGRTIFMPTLTLYEKKRISKKEAIRQIAQEFSESIEMWKKTQKKASK